MTGQRRSDILWMTVAAVVMTAIVVGMLSGFGWLSSLVDIAFGVAPT